MSDGGDAHRGRMTSGPMAQTIAILSHRVSQSLLPSRAAPAPGGGEVAGSKAGRPDEGRAAAAAAAVGPLAPATMPARASSTRGPPSAVGVPVGVEEAAEAEAGAGEGAHSVGAEGTRQVV